jgi:hypothetical protein
MLNLPFTDILLNLNSITTSTGPILGHGQPALAFEIMSLEAKAGDDTALIARYRAVEALAKLRDVWPAQLWAEGISDESLSEFRIT